MGFSPMLGGHNEYLQFFLCYSINVKANMKWAAYGRCSQRTSCAVDLQSCCTQIQVV